MDLDKLRRKLLLKRLTKNKQIVPPSLCILQAKMNMKTFEQKIMELKCSKE